MSAPNQHEGRAAEMVRTEGDDANPMTPLRSVASRGALWVSATTAIAVRRPFGFHHSGPYDRVIVGLWQISATPVLLIQIPRRQWQVRRTQMAKSAGKALHDE